MTRKSRRPTEPAGLDPIPLDASSVEGLAQAEAALVGFADETLEAQTAKYRQIAQMLLGNAIRLQLDADTLHLCEFARRVACEVMSAEQRDRSFGGDCWRRGPRDMVPPFHRHAQGGSSLRLTDVRSPERQAAAMVNTFAHIARHDPTLADDAAALLAFQTAMGLWTDADELDVD